MTTTILMGAPGTSTPYEVAWICERLGACARIAAAHASSLARDQAALSTALEMGLTIDECDGWQMVDVRDWMRRRRH